MTDYEERKTTADQTVAAFDAVAVVKSDATVIPTTRALYIGVTGNVVVQMNSGREATFTAVAASVILPIQVTKVKAATSATDILALY